MSILIRDNLLHADLTRFLKVQLALGSQQNAVHKLTMFAAQ